MTARIQRNPAQSGSSASSFGERVDINVRLVITPQQGRLWLNEAKTIDRDQPCVAPGEYVVPGQTVAYMEAENRTLPIISGFFGWMMGFLVPNGSPVGSAEAVAWLAIEPAVQR